MDLRKKLLLGFLAIAAIVLLAGAIGLSTADTIMKHSNTIIKEKVPLKHASSEAKISLANARENIKEYVSTAKSLDEIENRFDSNLEDYFMYISLVELGSNTQKFKTSQAGKTYLKNEMSLFVPKGSSEMISLAEQTNKDYEFLVSDITKLKNVHREIADLFNANYQQDGLFTEAVHKMETALKNPSGSWKDDSVAAEMLSLRRSEKNFFLRFKLEYQEEVNRKVVALKQKISSSERLFDLEKNVLNNQADVYLKEFNRVSSQLLRLYDLQVKENNLVASIEDSTKHSFLVLGDLQKQIDKEMVEAVRKSDNAQSLGMSFLVLSIISGLILAIIIGTYLSLNITYPIRKLKRASKKISEGDLTVKIDPNLLKLNDEVGSLAQSFNVMIEHLRMLIQSIRTTSKVSAISSEELSSSSQEVTSSMSQVAKTITELSNGAQGLSRNATDVVAKSKETELTVEQVSAATNSLKEIMVSISSSTSEESEKIKILGDKSSEIGSIAETINSIAEQTNLLALNATIEAARAGDAGRGFAVVADEVRKLAEKSATATERITNLIDTIQKGIQEAVESMKTNVTQVDQGSASIKEVILAMGMIPKLVSEENRGIGEISAIAEENAAASEEVSASVQEINSSMTNVSSSSQTLKKGAEDLINAVSKFKIEKK